MNREQACEFIASAKTHPIRWLDERVHDATTQCRYTCPVSGKTVWHNDAASSGWMTAYKPGHQVIYYNPAALSKPTT